MSRVDYFTAPTVTITTGTFKISWGGSKDVEFWNVGNITGFSLRNTNGTQVHFWPNAAGTGFNVSTTKPS